MLKAGSIVTFLSETGNKIPNKPATIIFKTIEMLQLIKIIYILETIIEL